MCLVQVIHISHQWTIIKMLLLEEIYKDLLLEAVKENSVINAIKTKRVILIDYDGDESNSKGRRSIEIYALGLSKSTGEPMIRAFQREGVSATKTGNDNPKNNIPAWRLFYLSKISSFKNSIQYHNGDRPDYRQNDKMMSKIIYQL
jgi:hypothetical protein